MIDVLREFIDSEVEKNCKGLGEVEKATYRECLKMIVAESAEKNIVGIAGDEFRLERTSAKVSALKDIMRRISSKEHIRDIWTDSEGKALLFLREHDRITDMDEIGSRISLYISTVYAHIANFIKEKING